MGEGLYGNVGVFVVDEGDGEVVVGKGDCDDCEYGDEVVGVVLGLWGVGECCFC